MQLEQEDLDRPAAHARKDAGYAFLRQAILALCPNVLEGAERIVFAGVAGVCIVGAEVVIVPDAEHGDIGNQLAERVVVPVLELIQHIIVFVLLMTRKVAVVAGHQKDIRLLLGDGIKDRQPLILVIQIAGAKGDARSPHVLWQSSLEMIVWRDALRA